MRLIASESLRSVIGRTLDLYPITDRCRIKRTNRRGNSSGVASKREKEIINADYAVSLVTAGHIRYLQC